MKRQEVENQLKHLIDQLMVNGQKVIDSDTSFQSDLGMDSLDAFDLCIQVESDFGISLDDDEWESIKTFGQAVDLLMKKLS